MYHYDINKPIKVTEETRKLTPHSFMQFELYEKEQIQYFFKHAHNNSTIVDIGAQSGLYTLYAKYLPDATFYAFEPYEKTLNLLLDNIKLNNIRNVHAYNYAISDKNGKAILNVGDHLGLNTLGNPLRDPPKYQIPVNTATLDSLNLEPDLIKIDTEGWEYYILKGAKNTIMKYRPFIEIEFNETNMKQANVDPLDLIALLKEYKYSVKHQIGEELFLIPDPIGDGDIF